LAGVKAAGLEPLPPGIARLKVWVYIQRRRQPSAGASSFKPILSSSTCGGGSTWTCVARDKATRTAVLSGSAVAHRA